MIYNIPFYIVIPSVIIPSVILFVLLKHFKTELVFKKYLPLSFCFFISFSIYCIFYLASFFISLSEKGTYEGRKHLIEGYVYSTIIFLGYLAFIIHNIIVRVKANKLTILTKVLGISSMLIFIAVISFYTLQFSSCTNRINNNGKYYGILKSNENLPPTPSKMDMEIDSSFQAGRDINIMVDYIDPASSGIYSCILKSSNGELLADYGVANAEEGVYSNYVSWYETIPNTASGKCYVYVFGNGEIIRETIYIH